jgi:biotin carboxyl carrier protein
MAEFEFLINDKDYTVTIDRQKSMIIARVGSREYTFQQVNDNQYNVTENEKTYSVAAVKKNGSYLIDIDAVQIEVSEDGSDEFGANIGTHLGEKDKVYAPMPGKIVKILVQKGQKVSEGQPLFVVEAMKMENQVNSPASGSVKAINGAAGDQVDTISPIIELEI